MAEIDVKKYKRRATRKKKELGKFLKKLAKDKPKGILKTVAAADKATWEEISCISCANCCKTMTPTYTRKDVNRISKHFKMSYDEFYKKWLKLDTNKDIINKSTPCQFLGKDNLCTIYEIRPDDCAGFPHFIRRDFMYQVEEKTYLNNIGHCPATLVFVENIQKAIEADAK
jgi:Fe-S-cluster containining protein